MRTMPHVSILTPVYNGEAYLEECIESVLAQNYSNWDYTIVNNRSTDRTLEISERYACKDARIRVQNNEEFLDIIGNHNKAFRLISAESKYCKIVSADDWLFPDCIRRLVELAEANPSVGIVGSYQLSGSGSDWRAWCVRGSERPYPSTIVPGRDACRVELLGGPYVFGAPTSILYRSDLVRREACFYPNPTPEADASACYKYLQNTDFGFVHQVLSYERIHRETMTTVSRSLNAYLPGLLNNLIEYGPIYLTPIELEIRLKEVLDNYYKYLAIRFINFADNKFWDYHKRRLKECGRPLSYGKLSMAVSAKIVDLIFNPKKTVERALGRLNRSGVS